MFQAGDEYEQRLKYGRKETTAPLYSKYRARYDVIMIKNSEIAVAIIQDVRIIRAAVTSLTTKIAHGNHSLLESHCGWNSWLEKNNIEAVKITFGTG